MKKVAKDIVLKFDYLIKNIHGDLVKETLVAQASYDYGTDYFSTDLLGSITSITDSYGAQKSNYTYDAFGSLVQSNLTGTTDHGYLGKQQDPTTKLYNYGYRDYKNQTARFITIDPIRDGTNWFSYCNGDPVNFIDLLGLCDDDKLASLKKQKELEEKLGYPNKLCYITSGLNAYISDEVVTEKFIAEKLNSIIKKNLDSNLVMKDFNIYLEELAKEIGLEYYYSYVYDKNNNWNQISYDQKEDFYNSEYPYGIGRYTKKGSEWNDKKGADHFELIRNYPFKDIINPGIADDEGNYDLHDILPLQKLKF